MPLGQMSKCRLCGTFHDDPHDLQNGRCWDTQRCWNATKVRMALERICRPR